MVWYGVAPDARLVALPLFVLLAIGAVRSALGLLLAALNVKYRDFRYVVPFLVQFGLFVSPVGFTTRSVPERWRALYRAQSDGRHHRRLPLVAARRSRRSIRCRRHRRSSSTLLSLVVGLWYFRRMERSFADVI